MKPVLFCSAITSLSLVPLSIWAQSDRVALEEIIVTAQKRPETLRDVPISVATLSGERFDALFSGGEDILGLASRVPGLYAESSNGRAAPRFYMRGLGNSDFDLAASQPVSIIFDEVVQENVVLKSFPIFDVEQVEVIRGPQGTLFGRNTTAGIIKFASRKPTEEFDGYVKTSAGDLGTFNNEGAVGGSLIDDTLMGRVSVLSQHRADWIDNDYTGDQDAMGGHNELAGRLQLLWTPTANLDILWNYHLRDYEGTATLFRANIFTPGESAKLNDNFDRDSVFFNQGDNNPQAYENSGTSLKVDWDLGPVTLTSISAYEQAEGSSLGDIDGGVAGVGPGFIPFDAVTEDAAEVEQLTEEIRVASNYDGPWQWQAGVYLFDSSLDVATTDGYFGQTTVTHENTSWSVFAQSSLDVLSNLTLAAGLRYTYDEKSLEVGAQNVDGFALVTGDATIQDYEKVDIDDDQVSGEISLNYRITDHSSLFSRIANGFRAQSIQGRDIAFEGNPSVAESETINSVEIGYKADYFDRSLRLNTSVFYYEVDDLQLTAVGGAGNFNALLNADQGVGSGFEFDVEWVPNAHMIFTLGGSYNKTEIQDEDLTTVPCGSGACTVTDPVTVVGDTTLANIDGNPFQSSPETLVNFTARFAMPAGSDSEWFIFTDWAWQGKTLLTLYEAVEYQVNNQFEGGLRLGYVNFVYDLEIAAFGRNITDEENIKGQIDFNNLTGFVNEPRIVGLDIMLRF
jgi:iron complex outermembrane receptor protein